MGGTGSTRWGNHRTRQTTDSLLSLDVREFARHGALTPGVWFAAQWTPSDWITYLAEDDALILDYRTKGLPDLDWIPIQDRIPPEYTPCHYGGSRPWFVCPGCGSRRAVLYSVGDYFRCRACHNLAYGSTRDNAWERLQRRAARLRQKIGAKPGRHHRARKPKGMHWRTFRRIQYEISKLEREGPPSK